MSSNERPCPIWDEAGPGLMPREPQSFNSPRAGGPFMLDRSGADFLKSARLSYKQKANLSYRIYQHNLRYRLLGLFPNRGGDPIVMDWKWVKDNQDRMPSTSDRLLAFLRELIRSDDAGEQTNEDLLLAAGGCRYPDDLDELRQYAAVQGWLGHHNGITLSTRIYVEEQLRDLGTGRKGFVAMWFDDSMDGVYEEGIKPALEAAGYEAMLIKNKEYLGDVTDEIVAEIRKSKFVVADFTTSREEGARGGVYFEAGFARGLGIPVIHTCRQDRMKAVHFDTNHFNHLTWKTPEDLRTDLQHRIEATLGRGPLDPSTERREL